jgi:hypothetical protein
MWHNKITRQRKISEIALFLAIFDHFYSNIKYWGGGGEMTSNYWGICTPPPPIISSTEQNILGQPTGNKNATK